MSASLSIFLAIVAVIAGYFPSVVLHTWKVMVALAIIVMGACIIYTINNNFRKLQETLKDPAKDNETKTE